MPSHIQIRNVPESLHRRIKAKAALEGKSLSDFLRGEIEQIAERPTLRELRQRLAEREPASVSTPPADVIREERDRR